MNDSERINTLLKVYTHLLTVIEPTVIEPINDTPLSEDTLDTIPDANDTMTKKITKKIGNKITRKGTKRHKSK